MEKQLRFRICEVMTDKKSIEASIVVRLKFQDIYGHVTQAQENVKPFLASACPIM